MRVLVYGFGPYRQFRDNITARIIQSLPKSVDLVTLIFPARFQRRQFLVSLKRYRPDIILGLGQSSRNRIDVETRARNRWRARKTAELRPIYHDRKLFLPTTLQIRAGRSIGSSTDAGDYVCNYSMYLFLDAIARGRRKVAYGFIHIPYHWDLERAGQVVRRILRQCYQSS